MSERAQVIIQEQNVLVLLRPGATFNGDVGGGGGSSALADLTDVTGGPPATGEAPVWDGDSFELTNVATQAELDAAISAEAATRSAADATKQPLDADLTAIAALTTTAFGRALLELANQGALLAAAGAAAAVHAHAGEDITSGTVADARIAATIARDSEVTAAIAALSSVYQPLDSDLTSIAALSTTSYGRGLLELANLAALYSLLNVDTDGTLAANSDTKIATQKAVKTYADALVAANDAMVFKGVIDASSNPNYPAADRGHTYKISVAGKIGGASGPNVEAGDLTICLDDATASGTEAAQGSHWTILQTNIDGAVIGPASSTSGDFATFSGTSGKVVQDSGLALDTDGALAANSDAKLPSQKAVKTYADVKVAKSLYDAFTILAADADDTPAPVAMGASTILARLASGGIVAATPSQLRTLLALVVGTNVQAWDADLDALAGLTSAADKMPYSTGAQAWAMADLSSFARTLLDDTTAAAFITTLKPPGYQFDLVSITSDLTSTATSDATAVTVITSNSVTYDGSTIVRIEFYAPTIKISQLGEIIFNLYDGSTDLGRVNSHTLPSNYKGNGNCALIISPSAGAHIFSIRLQGDIGTKTVFAGAGGAGTELPAYLQITKVV